MIDRGLCVGDLLVAKASASRELGDLTAGKEYEVTKVQDGDARIIDDRGDVRLIDYDRFHLFTVLDAERLGFVRILTLSDGSEEEEPAGERYVITVEVDLEGYKTIARTANKAQYLAERKEVKAKMARLVARLDEINEEVAKL